MEDVEHSLITIIPFQVLQTRGFKYWSGPACQCSEANQSSWDWASQHVEETKGTIWKRDWEYAKGGRKTNKNAQQEREFSVIQL